MVAGLVLAVVFAAIVAGGAVAYRRTASKPRLVRLHLRDQNSPAVDGILLGVKAGHYRVGNATHVESATRSHALDGEAWVPVDRVLYMQVTG